VAGWSLSSLPKALGSDQVAALLSSCDRATSTGCRDFAILTLLVRRGLRAGEVAGLAPHDIDWRRGEITVRGKGSRHDQLPLPGDPGRRQLAGEGALDSGRTVALMLSPRRCLYLAAELASGPR
jgi:integrase/recombinase XerD